MEKKMETTIGFRVEGLGFRKRIQWKLQELWALHRGYIRIIRVGVRVKVLKRLIRV